MAGGGTAVVCQVIAGMGGVGKTQLAANLAHGLWDAGRLDLLVWVTAAGRTAVVDAYARAAADVTGVDDPDREQAAGRFVDWLAATPVRWLVVLDDVADPADVAGWWPPDTATGRTVATTRRRDAALLAGRRLIDVGVFTREEAHAYLAGQIAADRLGEADRLAAELGYLPIALAQAAAYLLDRDLTCAAYRARLARRRLDRLRPDALPDDQQHAVADTWGLSIRLADAGTAGLATPILRLAALLDANGIPADLFTTRAVLRYCQDTLGRPVVADDAADAIRALHRLSLADITRDPETGHHLVRVHALVQRVVAEDTADQPRHRLARTAAGGLLQLWQDIERDAAGGRLAHLLGANTTALVNAGGSHLWHNPGGEPDAHQVLFTAGQSLGGFGSFRAARDYFHELHTRAVRMISPEDPETLFIRHNHAFWRGRAGDAAGAAAALEQLLADYLRVFGPDHRETLLIRHNLARWRGHAGDQRGAVTAYEQLLADNLRLLGPDHPTTLMTRHGIAKWRGRAGDAAGAAAAFEQLLADYLRVLGPDHPETLLTRHYLAGRRGEAGDEHGAILAFEQLLNDYLRVLGPDHTDTLMTRYNLAYWKNNAGDEHGASTAYEQLLNDYLRVLGPDHPNTLKTRHNIATIRGNAGDLENAVAAFEQLLNDSRRVLGPDHPDTLTARSSLAYWRGLSAD